MEEIAALSDLPRAAQGEAEDEAAIVILEILEPVVLKDKLKFPRGGYLVLLGRGHVIVKPAQYD